MNTLVLNDNKISFFFVATLGYNGKNYCSVP